MRHLLGAALLLLLGVPAYAESWNVYQNYTSSFFVPFVGGSDPADTKRFVNLTLSFGDTTKTTPFVMDTGSTGIAAGVTSFKPNPSRDTFIGPGSITYTSSNLIELGNTWLTDVVINGSGGNTITARVPILNALTECPTSNPDCGKPSFVTYMGIGFDRGGAPDTTNKNPFLSLISSNVPGVDPTKMRAGYIITNSDSPNGVPGVTLGLTGSNTSDFTSFVKLPANGTSTPGCKAPVPECVYNSGSAIASVAVNNQNVVTNGAILPDSGIVYMIVQTPVADSLPKAASCPAVVGGSGSCLANGAVVKVSLPGISYQFTVGGSGNPNQPAAVEYFRNSDQTVNAGVGFYGAIDYLYDAAGGYTGYRWNRLPGAGVNVAPLLALQGHVAFDSGFMTDFPVLLMPGTTTLSGSSTGSPGIFSSNLSGPGALAVNSGNYWLMGSNNTYGGSTTVRGGSLTLGPGATLPFGGALVIAGGTFNLNGNTQVLGSLDGSGGTLAMGGGMLVLNTTTANTLASSITGTGNLIVQGGGSINLTGNNSSFTGSTAVSNSNLAVNGRLGGNVFVGDGGVVSGTGSIGGNLANAGTVAPGNSIGTVTVGSNFAQTATGTYNAEVASNGQSDKIVVSGKTTIQGGAVAALPQSGVYAPRTTYAILTSAGGVSGTYAAVTSSSQFLQPTLAYDANNVYLTMAIGGFAAAAQTPTQYAVGAVLDANAPGASDDFANILGTIAGLNSSTVMPFLTSISGQNYSAFSNSMVQGAQLFMNNFALQAGGGSVVGPGGGRVALAEACDVTCQTTSPALWGAWGGALGGTGTVGAGTTVGSTTYNVGGFAGGLDRLFTPNFLAGVTVGYTTGTQWVSGFSGQSATNTVQAGVYGGFFRGPVYLDGMASYAYSTNQMWRKIAIPNLQQRTAQGLTGANQFFGQIEGGYRVDLGGTAMAFITPFARLQGYTGTQNAFTETGAQSLSLTVASQTTNSLRSVIGAQLGGSMDLGWRDRLYAQFRLGWSHEYADVSRPVTASLAGAPGFLFTTYGSSPQRDGAVVGLSLTTAIANASSLYLRYEGNIAGQDSTHALTAGLRMTW
ncbi:MAG: autotransporter domain-containing protein [Reyranellaceae bacterium]